MYVRTSLCKQGLDLCNNMCCLSDTLIVLLYPLVWNFFFATSTVGNLSKINVALFFFSISRVQFRVCLFCLCILLSPYLLPVHSHVCVFSLWGG